MTSRVNTTRKSRSGQLLFLLGLSGLALNATGCVNTDFRIGDQGAIVPTARVTYKPIGPLPRNDRFFRFSGLSLEGDVSYVEAKGTDRNKLEPGEAVQIGRTTIPGAPGIKGRTRVVDVKGTIRGGLLLGNVFRLEPTIGFEALSAGIRASNGLGQQTQLRQAAGFIYGLRAGVQPHEFVEIYGRALQGFLSGSSLRVDGGFSLQAETGLRITPIDNFGFFAGYRWARYSLQVDKEQSDIRLILTGPVIGLDLRF